MRFLRPICKKYLFWLAGSIAILLFFTIFGGRSVLQIYHLKEERERIRIVNDHLREENQKFSEQVARMKHNKKEEVEKFAREELGLVRKGEVVYQFEK
jgi:cell division protein FtsB